MHDFLTHSFYEFLIDISQKFASMRSHEVEAIKRSAGLSYVRTKSLKADRMASSIEPASNGKIRIRSPSSNAMIKKYPGVFLFIFKRRSLLSEGYYFRGSFLLNFYGIYAIQYDSTRYSIV